MNRKLIETLYHRTVNKLDKSDAWLFEEEYAKQIVEEVLQFIPVYQHKAIKDYFGMNDEN